MFLIIHTIIFFNMKKILLLIIICLFVGQAWAQIPQGARLVSGSFGANYNWAKQRWAVNHSSAATIASSYSYFGKNNLCKNIGLGIRMANDRFTGNGTGNINMQSNSNLSVNFQFGYTNFLPLLFVNKHLFLALNSYASPEGHFSHSVNSLTNTQNSLESINYSMNFSLGIAPSLAFHFKERWLLSANMGLIRVKYTLDELRDFPIHYINTNINLSPAFWGIGVGYFLSPKS